MRPDLSLISGRIQALKTAWCHYKPASLLVDCGDGCMVDMGNTVGSPRILALTHGHSDHILGLPNFLLARQLPTLVSGGPVTVVYPEGTPQIRALRQFFANAWPQTTFDRVHWKEIVAGERIAIGPNRDIVGFPTRHLSGGLTLGYAVVEKRFKLPKRLEGLSGDEISQIAKRDGRDSVREMTEVAEFLHTGDTMACAIEWMKDASIAVVDATFLDAADRDGPTHASVGEALEMAAEARHIVLHHISQRYARVTLIDDVREKVLERGVDPARVTLWDDTTWTTLG